MIVYKARVAAAFWAGGEEVYDIHVRVLKSGCLARHGLVVLDGRKESRLLRGISSVHIASL